MSKVVSFGWIALGLAIPATLVVYIIRLFS